VKLSKEEMLESVRRDLRITMGITAKPVLLEQVIWKQGIPQYKVGHAQKVQNIMDSLKQHEGLYLTGNAFYGVGVNDCVREAKRTASSVVAYD
jgi:protoporphyrinogen/coproporphyrinogen III oxidase